MQIITQGVIGPMHRIPSEEILKYISDNFEYCSTTGELLRFYDTPQKYVKITGVNSNGYIRVYIKSKEYLAHRVCWFLNYEEWPKKSIDHINRIKTDNRLNNLREASPAEQLRNTSVQSNHGHCFYFHKRLNKYEVCIRKDKRMNYIGLFDRLEDAIKARDLEESKK